MVQVMKSLRELHRDHKPLVSPLAHDALSARLIEHLGFKTFNIGGSALLAARHALPDLGLAGFAEMLAGVRDIVEASKLPCLVDADDGYGDVKSVVRTIQGYEAAGVSGALLEDQSRERKQPGAASASCVVAMEIMEQKLKAAQTARRSPDFVIIGRTDAYGVEGLDAALKRAERIFAARCRWYIRSRAEDTGRFPPGRQSFQRRVELRRNLRSDSDAVADTSGTPRHGFFPSRLSKHRYRAGGESDREWPASPREIGGGAAQCLRGWRAGNGSEGPCRCARFAKVERAGKQIPAALASMMEPAVDHEQKGIHGRCEQHQQERDRHDQINIV